MANSICKKTSRQGSEIPSDKAGRAQPGANSSPAVEKLLLETGWNVTVRHIEYSSNVRRRLAQQGGRLVYNVAIRVFRFHNEHHHVHESRKTRGDARLANRGHVKDDVIEVG